MTSDVNQSAIDVSKTVAGEGMKGSAKRETIGKMQKDQLQNPPESNKETLRYFDKELVKKKNGEDKGETGKTKEQERFGKSENKEENETKTQKELVQEVKKTQLNEREHFTKDDRETDKKSAENTKHCNEKDKTDKIKIDNNGKIPETSEGHKDTSQGHEPASRPNDQPQRTANKIEAGNQRQPEMETRPKNRTSARLDEGNHRQEAALVEHL